MSSLEIVQIGHPVLRELAIDIPPGNIKTEAVQLFIDQLIATKRKANGAGIAANQVGRAWRVYVVEVSDNPRYPYKPSYPLCVMINPTITFLSEARFANYEGCLSIPNLRGLVSRCPHIRVQGFDREAQSIEIEVRGVSAGTFQHEQDHLDGVLFTDKLTSTQSLCTWDEFSLRHQQQFAESVKKVEAEFNVEGSA